MLVKKNFIDPRTKLFLLIPVNLLMFFHTNIFWEIIMLIYLCFILLILQKPKLACKFTCAFLLSIFIEFVLLSFTFGIFTTICSFFIIMRKVMFCVMVGQIIFSTTMTSELMAAMKKMFFPNILVIPIAVVARFFPTLKEDWISVRNAMKMRGIGLEIKQMIIHPLLHFEYLLVPFLMASLKTSEELSAAALSRGINNPKKHSTLQHIGFSFLDICILLLTTLLIICIIFFN